MTPKSNCPPRADAVQQACSPLGNDWFRGTPPENGQYLRGYDDDDEDEDCDLYEYQDGKWYLNGNERFCYGGVWKPVSPANS